MKKKVFISYSHKDEQHLEQMSVHLATMRNAGLIDEWTDRKISAGDDWSQVIHEKLETADVIVFLVSPDFLASSYCTNVEMKRALERHHEGGATVIPILLRHCEWSRTSLSKLKAIPKDAKPISTWPDKDEAWLNVMEALRSVLGKVAASNDLSRAGQPLPLTSRQVEWLNDTEVKLTHRRVDKVSLQDVYVSPDLKAFDKDIDRLVKHVNEEELTKNGHHIVFGEEQAGKTSLAKSLYSKLLSLGKTPIVLNGERISEANILSLARDAFAEQYAVGAKSNFDRITNKAIIIDDFSKIRLNKKYSNEFARAAKAAFNPCIFLASDSYQYVAADIEELDDFSRSEISAFGNQKRSELIEKWVTLGIQQQIDEASLFKQCDDITLRINALVRKNIVPSKPIFLLSILQMLEAYTPQKIDLTSYGHCYQYLVYQALERAKISNKEIDKYLNVMAELAWAQLKNGGPEMSKPQLNRFFEHYSATYLRVDEDRVIADLTASKILSVSDDAVKFKYPYIYYFFAAKRIAESIETDAEVKQIFGRLLLTLHREDSANIIIFITHHTKNNWVLDEIQVCLMELFDEQKRASLSSESLQFMRDFLADIPELVLEQRKVEEERKRRNVKLDEDEERRAQLERAVEKVDPSELLAKINKVFKCMEIVGQIIRNRHGSLSKQLLRDLTEEGFSSGLRFLQYFLGISDTAKDEVVKIIEHELRENPMVSSETVEKEARHIFIALTYRSIYGVLRKMSASLGTAELGEIYEALEAEWDTPAIKLVCESIQLQFEKRLDFDRLAALKRGFSANPTCDRLLRELVIQHAYMFPVDYKDKQRISQTLGIPVASQRLMDLRKNTKQ